MDKIVKQEAGNEDEESFMNHITIKNEPGTSEVLVKQEAGNEDEESFKNRITIKNNPGISEVFVKQEVGNEVEESLMSRISIKNEPGTPKVLKQEKDLTNARTQSHRDDNLINKYTNSTVLVAKEIPLKTECTEDDHHDGYILLPKPPQTDFISYSVPTEDYFKKEIFEHSEFVNHGENKDIVLHSTDTVQKYSEISKTGLADSDAVKVETHSNSNTKTRDPICELKITRVQTVLPEGVTSGFIKDPEQGIIAKPVKDNSPDSDAM